MTDPALLARKLAQIEAYVGELRRLARPSRLREDVREARFVQYTLLMAVQCALDVASHIVADERLGEPDSNRELFQLLHRNGWIGSPLAARLVSMAGFRNILVHAYDEVNLDIVDDVVRNRLDDLLAFVAAIRGRLPAG